MRSGFIFNQNLCVNCKACCAACALENHFDVKPRSVVTFNPEVSSTLPLSNLSIACNHCEVPVCMNGCPAAAYLRDPVSGAVVLDEKKCIGCSYCVWNCPYDAPKYDPANRVIGKCHLCYSRLESGLAPACADGCPTGALSYGNTDDFDYANKPPWFPETSLNPALAFAAKSIDIPLRIVPDSLFTGIMKVPDNDRKNLGSEWSLVLFSFLTVLSVSIMASSFIKGVFPDKLLFISIALLPGVISIFHLGRWTRAWRAVINIKNSPLSREISIFIVYLILSCYSITYEMPWLIVSSSVLGFLLLLAIDSVYFYSVRTFSVLIHSGQTFLTSLLIISFLADSIVPFLFIAVIKIIFSVYFILHNPGNRNLSVLRFIRLAFLTIAGASFVSGISYPEPFIIVIFISGELIDRILFYLDFEPPELRIFMNNHLAKIKNEKERD
jgi:Fe-S-cluster-containing dehydrogenase component/DMSO reductase anchor subunit